MKIYTLIQWLTGNFLSPTSSQRPLYALGNMFIANQKLKSNSVLNLSFCLRQVVYTQLTCACLHSCIQSCCIGLRTVRLFISGITIQQGWSEHKWTAHFRPGITTGPEGPLVIGSHFPLYTQINTYIIPFAQTKYIVVFTWQPNSSRQHPVTKWHVSAQKESLT